jgi:hypothetical protein
VFDHIEVIRLPEPGGYAELSEYLAQFSAEPLELDLLWSARAAATPSPSMPAA